MTDLLAPSTSTIWWAALKAELDIWQSAGRTATFWWRDDDAVTHTPALDRLLALAHDDPIALSVIPAAAEPALSRRLAGASSVTVLQHGWRHADHAAAGQRQSEFGAQRSQDQRIDDLRLGRERLQSLFGRQALPVLVPPWSSIAPDLVPHLPEIGITGLSLRGARETPVVAGVRMVNIHVDLVDWDSRSFLGEARALGLLVGHLRSRILGTVDATEPTGVLTHHLVESVATEDFLRRLLDTLRRHPAALFVPTRDLFPEA